MKKLPLIMLLLFLNCGINSQFITHYGFKAGIASSYQSYETFISHEESSSGNRTGLDIGAFIVLINSPVVNAVPELHYIQKGTKFVISEFDGLPERTGETEYTSLNYISVPLFAKFTLPFGSVSPYIMAGPRVDILISKDENILNGFYKSVKKLNWGYTLAAGFSKKIFKKTEVLLEFRYGKDFTAFPNTEITVGSVNYNYGNEVGVDIKNTSMEFLIGVAF